MHVDTRSFAENATGVAFLDPLAGVNNRRIRHEHAVRDRSERCQPAQRSRPRGQRAASDEHLPAPHGSTMAVDHRPGHTGNTVMRTPARRRNFGHQPSGRPVNPANRTVGLEDVGLGMKETGAPNGRLHRAREWSSLLIYSGLRTGGTSGFLATPLAQRRPGDRTRSRPNRQCPRHLIPATPGAPGEAIQGLPS